jgi:hypothetical protein
VDKSGPQANRPNKQTNEIEIRLIIVKTFRIPPPEYKLPASLIMVRRQMIKHNCNRRAKH